MHVGPAHRRLLNHLRAHRRQEARSAGGQRLGLSDDGRLRLGGDGRRRLRGYEGGLCRHWGAERGSGRDNLGTSRITGSERRRLGDDGRRRLPGSDGWLCRHRCANRGSGRLDLWSRRGATTVRSERSGGRSCRFLRRRGGSGWLRCPGELRRCAWLWGATNRLRCDKPWGGTDRLRRDDLFCIRRHWGGWCGRRAGRGRRQRSTGRRLVAVAPAEDARGHRPRIASVTRRAGTYDGHHLARIDRLHLEDGHAVRLFPALEQFAALRSIALLAHRDVALPRGHCLRGQG